MSVTLQADNESLAIFNRFKSFVQFAFIRGYNEVREEEKARTFILWSFISFSRLKLQNFVSLKKVLNVINSNYTFHILIVQI